MTKKELAHMMDHTLLKAFSTPEDIEKLCKEAVDIGAASVCINPCYVKLAADLLKKTDVKVCTVIGFPLGASTSEVKAFETKDAIANGAQEVDMVINIGALKAGHIDQVCEDMKAVKMAAGEAVVKVIIETCYLTDEEKRKACQAAEKAGVDFVKTSTGFGTGGANAHDVALMKQTVSSSVKIKASGGMRTWNDVKPILEAGADRLGVSASLNILAEYNDLQ